MKVAHPQPEGCTICGAVRYAGGAPMVWCWNHPKPELHCAVCARSHPTTKERRP